MTTSPISLMSITSEQVLEMLFKAQQLFITYEVNRDEDEYFIQFRVDWYAEEGEPYSEEIVFIDGETKDGIAKGDWTFENFMLLLDRKIEERTRERTRAERRKQLIAQLTEEEKELLGLE